MTNATLVTFIWKRQTVSGKRGENMVTWSLLPFAVCRKRDAKSLYYREAGEGTLQVETCQQCDGLFIARVRACFVSGLVSTKTRG